MNLRNQFRCNLFCQYCSNVIKYRDQASMLSSYDISSWAKSQLHNHRVTCRTLRGPLALIQIASNSRRGSSKQMVASQTLSCIVMTSLSKSCRIVCVKFPFKFHSTSLHPESCLFVMQVSLNLQFLHLGCTLESLPCMKPLVASHAF